MTSDRRNGVIGDYAIKTPVLVATTANITLSGLQTIDGVALAEGDRVLVKNQSTGSQNGIYEADTGTWNRAADFDGPFDIVKGTLIPVTNGTVNSASYWFISTANPITIGTTSLTMTRVALGVSADPITTTGITVVNGSGNTVISSRVDGTYGGVLRITNTVAGTYVELFCMADGTLGTLDSNGNGYLRLYNTTFGGSVSIRCDATGEFSLVSNAGYEMFQVFQDGTTQAQGPLEKTVSGTSYTLLAADRGKLINFTSGSAVGVTVPLDFLSGQLASSVFYWRQAGAGQITFSGAGGVTIRNVNSQTKSQGQYAMGMLHQMADVNTWNLVGATGA